MTSLTSSVDVEGCFCELSSDLCVGRDNVTNATLLTGLLKQKN